MATVFAAREETQYVRRLVALKVLSPNIQGDDAEHRAFLREAEIATRLEHPNIVRIFDVGEADGAMYLAMELVHGTSLSALLKASKGPVPLNIALRLVSDVAGALHHAHELADPNHGALGVVHQDVSPQNVLVSYEGTVKLVDFGVARLSTFEGSRTETLRGKPSYASPEQIAGKNIDRRTDVFALGIIMWELLSGERLFRRETSAATYLAVIQGTIPYVREKNAEVPAVLADQIAKALEREREARFKSAEAFRAALSAAAKQVGVAEASTEELTAWVRRLVPPSYAKDELDREIATTMVGVAPKSSPNIEVPKIEAPKIIEAAEVPDLDLPVVDPTASTPTKPVPKPTTSAAPPQIVMPRASSPGIQAPSAPPRSPSGSAPQLRAPTGSSPQLRAPTGSAPQIRQSAPDLAPSSSRMQAMTFDPHDDDEMEIERDVVTASMPASGSMHGRPSSGAMRAAPPPRIAATASGLELAAQRSGLTEHYDEAPSLLTSIAAILVPLICFGGALFALAKFAHRPGGLDPLHLMPHAFDGSSVAESGVVAVVSFIVALALGAFGLKFHPRSWAMVASGGTMLLTALAMVTVTLASSGENPMPPDGALLIPYLGPLSLACLALGIAGRGRYLFLRDSIGMKIAAVPLAAFAGAVAFIAVESSRFASFLN
jgi:serine/threonine protein kinase